MIGVVSPVTSKYIYTDIISGIEEYAHEHDFNILLSNSNGDYNKQRSAIELMLEKNIDGLIIEPVLSSTINEDSYIFQKLRNLTIPYVTMDCRIDGLSAPFITIDDYTAGYQATEFLIGEGHKKIGMIFKEDVLPGKMRQEGMVQALKDHRLAINPEYILGFPDKAEKAGQEPAYHLTRQLIDLSDPPTAIFYYNDETAFRGFKAIKQKKWTVPQDISILGFDDSEFADLFEVPLTTFKHPKKELGKKAMEILLDLINNSNLMKHNLLILPELIKRQSVLKIQQKVQLK
ncbi:MAG: substrate-binding domain-containing protein [Spirochaetes bacterium]|nr:substrate-binding domain-containing protein [Spirochaetota bacterium]